LGQGCPAFCRNGQQLLLWAASRAAHLKITVIKLTALLLYNFYSMSDTQFTNVNEVRTT